jgi:hypothetical protein
VSGSHGLETGIRLKAQLVLLQEPTTKLGIRHPGYRLIWPQEGGSKPRTLVGVRTDAKIKVEYRSDLGQNTMGDVMVLNITLETGRKIRVVNLYDQLEVGRNTNTRPTRMARIGVRNISWKLGIMENTHVRVLMAASL